LGKLKFVKYILSMNVKIQTAKYIYGTNDEVEELEEKPNRQMKEI
jgi:hypothetical protein